MVWFVGDTETEFVNIRIEAYRGFLVSLYPDTMLVLRIQHAKLQHTAVVDQLNCLCCSLILIVIKE